MAKGEFVDIAGIDRARLLQELFAHAGSAGLGAVRMFIGMLEDEPEVLTIVEAEKALRSGRTYSGVSVDYLRGRRMKLYFEDKHPDRLWCVQYDECSDKKARDIVTDLRAEAGDA